MEQRVLGRTGLRVSALGFGCGDVGGLIVRGTPAERERAVARAVEAGINYFDTASSYGSGESERNLGQTLKAVGVRPYVGTKFRLDPAETDLAAAIARSLEASLQRLGLDSVDLFQLHNLIVAPDGAPAPGRGLPARRVLDEVVPALAALRRQGKIRFAGITALGDTGAVHTVLDAGVIDTAQVCLNLLNPSAAVTVAPGFPAQDFGRLLDRARNRGVGVINIRVLAAGAVSGVMQRHVLAMPSVAPIASGPDYAADVERAQQLRPLVDKGHAADLVEASIRFSLASEAVSTVLVGYSTLEHLEKAIAAVERGPLPAPALDLLNDLWAGFARR
ncbi:MAG: aldo/keto reductase [Candidatus Rokuibacteriota bacterium]|nr:MAG: aldo/keto reductase [Candidatus Rokubacteria bacterium]